MRLRAPLVAAALAVLLGCNRETRHDYEAAADEIAAEQNNVTECHDCEALNLGNGMTAPLS